MSKHAAPEQDAMEAEVRHRLETDPLFSEVVNALQCYQQALQLQNVAFSKLCDVVVNLLPQNDSTTTTRQEGEEHAEDTNQVN